MKKINLIIPVLLLIHIISGQTNFTVSPETTVGNIQLGRELVIESPIHNVSDESLTLAMVRSQNDLPEGWTSAMCIGGICFPADYDTIITNWDYFQQPIAPGEERQCSLDIFSNGANTVHGTAYIQLHFYDVNNPDDSVVFDFVVSSLSNPPISNAGEDQTVIEGDLVYLDGSFSEDPDGDELSFLWTSTPELVFDDPESETPVFTAPYVDETVEYECILTLNDEIFNVTDTVNVVVESTAGISQNTVPKSYKLLPAFPNPFNPETTISYELHVDSPVKVLITNLKGEAVYQWGIPIQNAGLHSIKWNAINQYGVQLSSGIYLCTVELGTTRYYQKLVLAK